MRRRLILLLICLVPILGTLWARSYFVADSVEFHVGPRQHTGLALYLSASRGSFWIHIALQSRWYGSWLHHDHNSSLPQKTDRNARWFDTSPNSVAMRVPYWAVITLVTLPAIWLLRRERRAQKLARSICLTCGYDLRASQDRCPECGTAIPNPAPAVST